MKRIFLCGPMTGLPMLNYPAFNAEAARLRGLGYHVENPAENLAPPCGSWAGYLRLSLAQILTCDTLALLPGWPESRGAIKERNAAMGLMLVIGAVAITETCQET